MQEVALQVQAAWPGGAAAAAPLTLCSQVRVHSRACARVCVCDVQARQEAEGA